MQVDLDDRFINEYVDFDEGSGEIFDEEVEFSTRNMTTQQQKEGNKFWLEKSDKLAKIFRVGGLLCKVQRRRCNGVRPTE